MHLRDYIGRPDRFSCSIDVWKDEKSFKYFIFPEAYFLTDAIYRYFDCLSENEKNNFLDYFFIDEEDFLEVSETEEEYRKAYLKKFTREASPINPKLLISSFEKFLLSVTQEENKLRKSKDYYTTPLEEACRFVAKYNSYNVYLIVEYDCSHDYESGFLETMYKPNQDKE